MSTTTDHLGLFKYDPSTDGSQTFNIQKALNENWDKVDAFSADSLTMNMKGAPDGVAALGPDGKVPEE